MFAVELQILTQLHYVTKQITSTQSMQFKHEHKSVQELIHTIKSKNTTLCIKKLSARL